MIVHNHVSFQRVAWLKKILPTLPVSPAGERGLLGGPVPRTPWDFQGIALVSQGTWKSLSDLIRSPRLEKRSRALRGRNPTRDIQADGAPMALRAPGGKPGWGPRFYWAMGHRSHA